MSKALDPGNFEYRGNLSSVSDISEKSRSQDAAGGMKLFREELPVQLGGKPATMVVRLYEPAKTRDTVFCIHGFEGNSGDFDYLARPLTPHGFRVVAPDIVGRGKSTYLRDPSMYTIETHVKGIQALSRYAGRANHFIGTSWGGAIVMYFLYFARLQPTSLILNDACLQYSEAVHDAMEFMVNDSMMEFDTLEEAHAYVRRTRGYLGKFAEELWGPYLDNKIIAQDGKYCLAYDSATTRHLRAPPNRKYDLFPLLENMTARTLLLYGADSRFYEERRITEIMNRRPNISCVPRLDGGHPPSLMTPDQAQLVLGFLRSP